MAVSAVGKLSVNCPQMSLDGHARRGIAGDQPEICLQLAFHAFKLGSGLLPDAIMVLISISPGGLPDTGPLLLFGYHVAKIIPQAIGHRDICGNFPDGTFKRAPPLIQFVGGQRVDRVLCRRHIKSL
jgi:hypothetical protein